MTENPQHTRSFANKALTSRPALTLIHVLWFAVAVGLTLIVYLLLRDVAFIVRVIATIVAFGLAFIATHLATVFIVTAWIIPRVEPGSYWEREVDSYMASVFPGQWGKSPGAA